MNRRQFIGMVTTLGLSPVVFASIEPNWQKKPLTFGLTPVFLDDQVSFLNQWKIYLEKQLNTSVSFVQRDSYEAIVTMLLKKELDIAWICGYPYVKHSDSLKIVSTPFYQDFPNYQSYIIVSSEEKNIKCFSDLKGSIFAYSDPDSNSGYVYVQYLLKKHGHLFFKKTFFTHSHRKSIQAVARGVADAAAVDGYVWDTLKISNPELVSKTRVIKKSQNFGFPPIVSHKDFPAKERDNILSVLAGMSRDTVGKNLLEILNLTGFRSGDDSYYHSIRQLIEYIG